MTLTFRIDPRCNPSRVSAILKELVRDHLIYGFDYFIGSRMINCKTFGTADAIKVSNVLGKLAKIHLNY